MSDYLTFALPKGRIMQDSMDLFARIGITCPEMDDPGRKLVFENHDDKLRFMAVRAQDVPTYVEHGCADIGVVGKDTLLEQDRDLYEPLDLGIARCRLMTAGRVGWKSDRARIRVATKFVNITRRHFASQGVHADVIKLYGAMELAPIMNLAELIVDIVDTGNTLKANGMEPLEEIAAISSRLIVNKAAMRSRHAIIQRVIDDLAQIVSQQSSGA